MPRTIKKRGKKAGLPLGTLVHVGERKVGKAMTIIDYDERQRALINPKFSLTRQ